MLCRKPFMVGAVPFGCGQCLPCRINRRRLWTWRCFLESLCHEESSFLTLTYSNEHLPEGGCLSPKAASLFLKRFRKAIYPQKVRYFLVGEYGDESRRPHYHASLFGVGPAYAPIVQACWPYGFSSLYEFNETTAQYVCGYVIKKLADVNYAEFGLTPEFARMSRRPGIGADAMRILADTLHSKHGLDEIERVGDVPHQLKIGKRSIPLGRYLRSKLREEMGFKPEMVEAVKQRFFSERSLEVLALFKDSEALSLSDALLKKNLGRIQSVEARSKIRRAKKL